MSRVCYLISIEFLREEKPPASIIFSIPTFSIYLLSKSPTRKQCPKNRCSDVGLETGLTSKMAPLGNFPHMKNVDIGLEIDPTHLKNLPHLKKKLTLPLVV